MPRPGYIAVALLLIPILFCPPGKARATGLYEDAVAQAGFLSARQANAVNSRLLVVDAQGTEGALVVMDVRLVFRQWLLLGFEQPFVTAAVDDRNIESGFGDFRIKARCKIFRRPGKSLSLLFDLGTGTGEARVFPFASQALETGASIAWVDSLGAVNYWAMLGGQTVRRKPDPDDLTGFEVLFDSVRLNAGLSVPLGHFAVGGGVSVLRFSESTVRDIFFGHLVWNYGTHFRFYTAAQIEGGRSDARTSNGSVNLGMAVYF